MPNLQTPQPNHAPPDVSRPAALSLSGVDLERHRPVLQSSELHDFGNAECFAAIFSGKLGYCPGLGWLYYNGLLWENAGEHKARLAAGETIRMRLAVLDSMSTVLGDKEYRARRRRLEQCANMGGISGMLALAEAMLHLGEGDLDDSPYLLNTASGMVNLNSGELLPHDPAKGMTRIAGVVYDPEARSELWENTINGIANDDPEVATFLQLIAGYACTGDVSAQKFFYFFGQGANGKSLVTDLWSEVLGGFGATGYAVRLSAETVVGNKERSAGTPSPDILSLRGRRLALFSEQAGDKPINPERLKDLTGGDSLTAREPFRNPVTFKPSFTLIGCGNHKPLIHGSDYAIWRRMLIVPFLRCFKPSRLADELREPKHMAAILRWMVEGSLRLHRDGWMTPRIVDQTCREYQTEADLIRQWLEDRCEVDANSETSSRVLFHSFSGWCRENKERQISNSMFTRRMEQINFPKRKSNGQVLLRGIRLQGQSNTPASNQAEAIL